MRVFKLNKETYHFIIDVLTWEGVALLCSALIGNSVGCREKIIPFKRNAHKIEKVVIINMNN